MSRQPVQSVAMTAWQKGSKYSFQRGSVDDVELAQIYLLLVLILLERDSSREKA
jgi:hypothetical protein